MPIKSDREYRSLVLEVKDGEQDEKKVAGYFTTFDSPYLMYRGKDYESYEVVDRNAFKETDISDVIMQYDHQGRVFARISNGTLELAEDDHGYSMEADLSGTTIGRQLFEEIKGGYTTKMSFGFTVEEDEWRTEFHEDGTITETRIIKKVGKLYDVSAVSLPANDQTEISARNLSTERMAKLETERLKVLEDKANELRLKLKLKIKLMED